MAAVNVTCWQLQWGIRHLQGPAGLAPAPFRVTARLYFGQWRRITIRDVPSLAVL